jgi:hypothetical protein
MHGLHFLCRRPKRFRGRNPRYFSPERNNDEIAGIGKLERKNTVEADTGTSDRKLFLKFPQCRILRRKISRVPSPSGKGKLSGVCSQIIASLFKEKEKFPPDPNKGKQHGTQRKRAERTKLPGKRRHRGMYRPQTSEKIPRRRLLREGTVLACDTGVGFLPSLPR